MSKVNYIYGQLSESSINRLKSLFDFKFDKHFGTYITLDWKVDSKKYLDILGKKYYFTIDTFAFDKYAEAFVVDFKNSELRSVNKNPHITWSVSQEFDPYYCNYMLETTETKITFKPVDIEITVLDGLF